MSVCVWCGGTQGQHDDNCLGAPAVRGSETSEAAAKSIAPESETLRDKILAAIRARGRNGLTDDEGEVMLSMRHQTYSARRRELYLAGRIILSGARRWTRARRFADVYIAAED